MMRFFVLFVAAILVCGAAAVAQTERKRVELTEPGVYKDSDCIYVMTKDVTVPGCGFTIEGNNCVIDLGGHTLTFNAQPYVPPAGTKYDYLPPWGILLKGADIELKNGTIAQGKGGNKGAHCVFAKGKNYDIHNLTLTMQGGWLGSAVFAKWGGSNVKLHHNYIVCDDDILGKAIVLNEAGANWDIHHNTVVGGHTGISVGQSITGRRAGKDYDVEVHDNYISHRRTRQQKTPQGIIVHGNGMNVHHNEIVSIDGRGLKPIGHGNRMHDNVIDVRYTRKAEAGFYPENRCYGLWARDRDSGGNIIENNLFVVNNEIAGDESSSSVGILLCTSPGDIAKLESATVTGNRFIVRHDDKSRPAQGFLLQNTGDKIVIKDNFIWAQTAGVAADKRTQGSRIENNTFVRTGDAWQLKEGEGADQCVFKDNRIIDPPVDKAPPAAPTGLALTPRFNGYELHWNANAEDDVLGYYVYRDGKRVEDRVKCGRFYVDVTARPGALHAYSISAVDLSGNESPKGAPVSTK